MTASELTQKICCLSPGEELSLSPGDYRFLNSQALPFACPLSNSDSVPQLKTGLLLKEKKQITIDGHGATLICQSQMCALALLACENITLKNFTIDWDIPLTAEGLILDSRETYIDVSIDPQKYPHHIHGDVLYFDGPGWSAPLHFWGHTEFDPAAGCLAPDRGDRFPPTRQAMLKNGNIRFYGDFKDRLPKPGNILVLRHSQRIHPAILIHNCNRITLQDITIHASCGLGILAQFSSNLTFQQVQLIPNRAAGRMFAGCHDDGIHLSANAGEILIENCAFLGLMDDPVNLHGIAAKVTMQLKGDTFRGKFMHPQSKGHFLWAEGNQIIALLNGDTMEELDRATVKNFRLLDEENFEIQFTKPVSQSCSSFSLENLSRTASLICRHNRFGSCRARGLLVCTPKKVLIAHNIFESPGAAIRIAGDVCTWYESGRCQDVTIEENIFTDTCLSNAYQGGQGIISISPELPMPTGDHPCHKNIFVTKNHFHISDSRILYALCTENLQFTQNEILKSNHYHKNSDSHFLLDRCTHTVIEDNRFLGF